METNCNEAFLRETSGHDEHPAELIVDETDGKSIAYLDVAGVSDPEGVSVPARTLTV